MNIRNLLGKSLVMTACWGICLPPTMAGPPVGRDVPTTASPRVNVLDVQLPRDGILRGQVLNPQGKPLPGASVEILQGKTRVASSTTDAKGQFAVPLRTGGVYVIAAGDAWSPFRVWPTPTAPPGAHERILLVAQSPIMRGQGSPLYGWIESHPYLFYAGVATAIVVPIVVVHETNDDDPEPRIGPTPSHALLQQDLPPASP
jgi:hypothetical protein